MWLFHSSSSSTSSSSESTSSSTPNQKRNPCSSVPPTGAPLLVFFNVREKAHTGQIRIIHQPLGNHTPFFGHGYDLNPQNRVMEHVDSWSTQHQYAFTSKALVSSEGVRKRLSSFSKINKEYWSSRALRYFPLGSETEWFPLMELSPRLSEPC